MEGLALRSAGLSDLRSTLCAEIQCRSSRGDTPHRTTPLAADTLVGETERLLW